MKGTGISKQKAAIVILAVLLALSLAYIGLGIYQQGQITVFSQGAQYGYEQAVIQIMQQASACQQVPLYRGNATENITVNLIAVECLQQAPAGSQTGT